GGNQGAGVTARSPFFSRLVFVWASILGANACMARAFCPRDTNTRPLTRAGMRSNCKSMERPDLKSVSVVQPDGVPDQVAAGFFPHFATVRSALEAGRIGVWSWDLATNTVTWSSNMEAIH